MQGEQVAFVVDLWGVYYLGVGIIMHYPQCKGGGSICRIKHGVHPFFKNLMIEI